MDMTVEIEGRSVVLAGRLDVHTVADVRLVLHNAIERGTGDLTINLERVEVTDATGLGVLVGVHRRADRAGRRLVLRGVPPRLSRLLLITRLHRIMHLEAPLAAAAS
jgi:anti-anti-sigma factor